MASRVPAALLNEAFRQHRVDFFSPDVSVASESKPETNVEAKKLLPEVATEAIQINFFEVIITKTSQSSTEHSIGNWQGTYINSPFRFGRRYNLDTF